MQHHFNSSFQLRVDASGGQKRFLRTSSFSSRLLSAWRDWLGRKSLKNHGLASCLWIRSSDIRYNIRRFYPDCMTKTSANLAIARNAFKKHALNQPGCATGRSPSHDLRATRLGGASLSWPRPLSARGSSCSLQDPTLLEFSAERFLRGALFPWSRGTFGYSSLKVDETVGKGIVATAAAASEEAARFK
jgi:hypothetical protein